MNLKTKKYFYFILLFLSAMALGYRISIFDFTGKEPIYNYAITISFLLIFIGSLYEWISIKKKLGEFK